MSLRKAYLKILLGLSFLALYAGNGCNKGATPPTPVFGDVQLGVAASTQKKGSSQSALTSGNGSALVSLLSDDVLVDEVRVNLRRVDLEPDNVADPGVEYRGPFVTNLVEKGLLVEKATPAFARVSVPVDTYSEIKFRIDPVSSSELPSGLSGDSVVQSSLIGQTLVVEGRFKEAEGQDVDGNGSVDFIPFRFISDIGADLHLEIPGNFQIEPGQTSFVFLVFRLISWLEPALGRLQGLGAQDLTGGIVLLTDGSASRSILDLVDLIEDAILGGTRFAESEDDKEFEEEEVEEDSFSEIDPEPGEETGGESLDQGVSLFEGEILVDEVRMTLDAFQFDGDFDLRFEGPMILSVIQVGTEGGISEPPFEAFGIPAGSHQSLEIDFQPLSSAEIPEGALADPVVTDILVDNTMAAVGSFLESPANDLDGDGEQSYIPFTLVSDNPFNSFVTEGVTNDVGSVIFPLLDPAVWFAGTTQLFQGLSPSELEEGSVFIADGSSSAAVRAIAQLVESNLEGSLP